MLVRCRVLTSVLMSVSRCWWCWQQDEIINIAQIRVLLAGSQPVSADALGVAARWLETDACHAAAPGESKDSLADMSNWIKSLDNGDIIRSCSHLAHSAPNQRSLRLLGPRQHHPPAPPHPI